jgi:hypothetical protein
MKKIVNVGFAPANEAETPQVNDVAVKVQPSGSGSGSGDGSGSGSGDGSGSGSGVIPTYFGNGTGTMESSIAGRWDVRCVFNWNASVSYTKINGVCSIDSFWINIANVSVTCTGVAANIGNVRCCPVDCSLLKLSGGSYSTLNFFIKMPVTTFTVNKYRPDQYGNEVPIGEETEQKRLEIECKFEIGYNHGVPKLILPEKCQITAHPATDYSAV